MGIETEDQLADAVREFNELRDAPDDSPQGKRRMELDAQIKMFYQIHAEDVRVAKPPR